MLVEASVNRVAALGADRPAAEPAVQELQLHHYILYEEGADRQARLCTAYRTVTR